MDIITVPTYKIGADGKYKYHLLRRKIELDIASTVFAFMQDKSFNKDNIYLKFIYGPFEHKKDITSVEIGMTVFDADSNYQFNVDNKLKTIDLALTKNQMLSYNLNLISTQVFDAVDFYEQND